MNTTRKALIVGNWKMHNSVHESSLLLHKLTQQVGIRRSIDVVLCPTVLAIQTLSLQINRRQFKLGAQHCYWRDDGAYTGEVSAAQLRGIADYVIVGHSERRHIFGQSDKDIRQTVQAVVRNDMKPILCIGETAQERADGETKHVIHDQVVNGLANVTSDELASIAIAYEPVWAIGSGENASPLEVEAVAGIIHKQVSSLYGVDAADTLRILYGGSVNDENASQYLAIDRIDGLLVGGASLIPHSFANIVDVAHNKLKDNIE